MLTSNVKKKMSVFIISTKYVYVSVFLSNYELNTFKLRNFSLEKKKKNQKQRVEDPPLFKKLIMEGWIQNRNQDLNFEVGSGITAVSLQPQRSTIFQYF